MKESVRSMQEQGQDLQDVLETIQAQKEHIDSEPYLVGIIAKAISDRFGGPLDKWRVYTYITVEFGLQENRQVVNLIVLVIFSSVHSQL